MPKSAALPSLIALMLATPALAGSPPAAPAPAPAPAAQPALIAEADLPLDPRFSPERLAADVGFLADDLLEGRDTGSRGHEIAMRFVAARFAALGLVPMGDVGPDGKRGWLQRITFQKTEYGDGPAGLEVTGPAGKTSLPHGKDVVVSLNPNLARLDLTAPLVFVGYGIDNARVGINDYAGLDVKGKVVVVLRGYPKGMASEVGAHLSSSKAKMAAAHGAVGVITLGTNASLKVRPWAKTVQFASRPGFDWIGPDGKARDEAPGVVLNAQAGDEAAAALLSGARKSLAQIRAEADRPGGRPRGFALKTTVHGFVSATTSRVSSANVVAMLPGGDPLLAKETVVLSGHLDHIGISPAHPGDAPDKDRINNGAMDNAVGSATTMEVARVMAADKTAPRRSVLFVVTTGEEKGLLGADYYARFPTLAKASIVGNVDLDMPILLYPFTDVIAYGAEHSTLGTQVAAAVAPMKIALSPDPEPAETIFVRSDHYMFVKQGVPAVFLGTGYANGGGVASRAFLDKVYHQPADDMNQAWNWRAGARFAEANWRITRAMADADTPPRWLKGDFFGDTFAPGAEKADK